MRRMLCHSIDLQGRPLEIGSVIKINGKLYAATKIQKLRNPKLDVSIYLDKL